MKEIIIAHSSDLHIGFEWRKNDLWGVQAAIRAAEQVQADVLLLAGDVFDHNRLPESMLEQATQFFAEADLRFIILPGNHDPLTTDSVYRRGRIADLENVDIIGITGQESIVLPEMDMEIWGRPHLDHVDMLPLESPRPRSTRWQIAMAHGLWVDSDSHHAWLIYDEHIAATDADYVALGHRDSAERVGNGAVPAYYSGSPDFARSINVVRFREDGFKEVTREYLNGSGD